MVLLTISMMGSSAVTLSAVLLVRPVSNPTPTPSITPKRNPIEAVAALGTIEPQGEVIYLSAPPSEVGARVEQLLVNRGDRVKAGDAIALLDSRLPLEADLQQAQQKVYAAQARLEQVKAGAKVGDILAHNAKYQKAKAELEGQVAMQKASIASLEADLEGDRLSKQATIERLTAELSNAQGDCDRYQFLYDNGAMSARSRDDICLKETTHQKEIEEAKANLQRISIGRREEIAQVQANLKRTILTQQRQIEEVGASLRAIAEVRPVDVRVAQADLEVSQAAAIRAKVNLDLAYIRAPKDGQILKVHSWPGEIIGDKGVVELGQTQQMYVTAQVYETDVVRIKVGHNAIIKSPVGDLRGTVDEIGLQVGRKDILGTDPVADVDARVVEVKIRLIPQDSQKVTDLTNLQVKAIVNLDEKKSEKIHTFNN
jgi:HlyD family secretion protein